jgi:hypothetical protein
MTPKIQLGLIVTDSFSQTGIFARYFTPQWRMPGIFL